MPRRHLTAAGVSRIKSPISGQVDHFDAGYPGLALRVSYGGGRSWVYFYRLHGRQRRLTLGPWPALTLEGAREAWRTARENLTRGKEPTAQPARSDAPDLFRTVLADWLKRDQGDNRSHNEVKRVLEKDALPKWRDRRVAEINRREIAELIDGIADRGAVTAARRCHAHLHRLFRWAAGRGIIELSPMAYLPKPGAEVKRKRVLSDEELRLAWAAAQQIGWPMGSAVQLLILTCARREEISALKWAEIDRADRQICLGGERTKNGEDHTIPLSHAAWDLIQSIPRLVGSQFVFTTTGNTPISGWSHAKEKIDEMMRAQPAGNVVVKPWRIHDLRRTAATGMERLGIKQQVVEALLGHMAGSKAGVIGIYQRHAYEQEKREALEKWTEHVAVLVASAK
jgi:integrase